MAGRVEWVLASLERAEVRYLVVGGVAVVLHGYLRTTIDLDIVLQWEQANVERALEALGGLGFQPQIPVPLKNFANPQIREISRPSPSSLKTVDHDQAFPEPRADRQRGDRLGL